MRGVLTIAGRNLRLFFSDPLNVFFSLLGALVVFLLYVLFLGAMQVAAIGEQVPGADPADVRGFVDSWMFAGIVTLATITTPLGALAVFIDDAASGRFRDFLVSPLPRAQLTIGYLGSAFAVGLVVTVIVAAVGLVYLALVDGVTYDLATVARTLGWIALTSAGFTGLWGFIASFVRTSGAFAGLSTIVGTVTGFVAGAYIPVGVFPDGIREAVSALPFAEAAMLTRREFTAGPIAQITGGRAEATEAFEAQFGAQLSVGGVEVAVWFAVLVLAVMAVVFTSLAAWRIRVRIG